MENRERPILALEQVSKFYTSGPNVVVGLNDVSLRFFRGEFVAITGESGSGKSTMAHVLGGILPYESGELYLDGKPTSHYDSRDWENYRRDNISFISQNYGILPNATVLENVVSALRLSGMHKKQAHQEAKSILEKVELWELRRRRAARLSSGQKQRLSIARALAKPAPILIADEPTGNLDPENSAKVIDLLAQAAQDRLVLLITHDFPEAQEQATRHITLQDGRLVMDTPLRPAPAPEQPAVKREKNREPLSLYVSRLQLGGRPVWGSFVTLFFALTAFAVFAFLGTFILSLDDADTRLYDNSAFRNGDRCRIVVQRADGTPITQEDYDRLLSVEHVDALERFGMIRDINYYIDGETCRETSWFDPLSEAEAVVGEPGWVQRSAFEFLSDTTYAQSIPLMSGGRSFLTAGRLPERYDEVVVAGDESLIGKQMVAVFRNLRQWSESFYLELPVTVVGVTDFGQGMYFHDLPMRALLLAADLRYQGYDFSWHLFWPDPFLPEYEVCLSEPLYQSMTRLKDESGLTTSEIFPWYHEGMAIVSATKDAGYAHIGAFYAAPQTFEEIFTYYETFCAAPADEQGPHAQFGPNGVAVNASIHSGPGQVSLTISHYGYTDKVLEQIQGMGYVAASPFRLGATVQLQSLADQRMQTLLICLAVLVVVLVLQVLVLRALFGGQTENFRLLANIGLTCSTAKRSVLWQMLALSVVGQGLAGLLLWLCARQGVERIVRIFRLLYPWQFALMSGVHLAAMLLAAVWVSRAVQKQVYPLFTHFDDLQIDEEEVAL